MIIAIMHFVSGISVFVQGEFTNWKDGFVSWLSSFSRSLIYEHAILMLQFCFEKLNQLTPSTALFLILQV